jgi:hypothetical protein
MHSQKVMKEPALWILVLLLAISAYLAVNRLYQVDEAQTVYMASVLARGWQGSLLSSGQLHLFPLSLLVRQNMTSSEIFLAFRLVFWALLWVNAALVVMAAGVRLRSMAGLRALVLTGTLAPWWAYGLECRHDNILMSCTLLFWILGRRTLSWSRVTVYFGLGALALLTQACLFKSIATWAPLSVLLLLLEPASWARRGVLAACWVVGAAAMTLLTHAILARAGLLGSVTGGGAALGMTLALGRILPTQALEQLLRTAPLLAAAMAALLVHAFLVLQRKGIRAAGAGRGMPELFLFLVGVLAFLANPTPFPYNLAVLSGLAMVAILALGTPWLETGACAGLASAPYLLTAGLVLHVLPLAARVSELAQLDNDRQEELMAMAEASTGPEDPVFDAIGLVPTRKGPSFIWLINLTNVQLFSQTPMTATWAGRVPPVLLPSYRFNYLQPADLAFLRGNYVSLRKDFYVLGQILTKGNGATRTWNCLRSGRYGVVPLEPDAPGLDLDGVRQGPGIQWVTAGNHVLAIPSGIPCALVWVGPTATSLPELRPTEGMDSVCPVPMAF